MPAGTQGHPPPHPTPFASSLCSDLHLHLHSSSVLVVPLASTGAEDVITRHAAEEPPSSPLPFVQTTKCPISAGVQASAEHGDLHSQPASVNNVPNNYVTVFGLLHENVTAPPPPVPPLGYCMQTGETRLWELDLMEHQAARRLLKRPLHAYSRRAVKDRSAEREYFGN